MNNTGTTWNKGRKMPHSKEWEEKRLKAVREAAKKRIYPRGYHRPEGAVHPMKEALEKWQKGNPEKRREIAVANLPKISFGEKNGNWRGGITKKNYAWRLWSYSEYKRWRENVLNKAGRKCVNCDSEEKLEAHHIISLDTLKETAFELWNGVCLCRKCHQKTDSWGGHKKTENIGKLRYLVLTIPHSWQEYDTCGNWKFTKSGVLIVLVSDLEDELSEFLVALHEIIEATLCKHRGISEKKITDFDLWWDKHFDKGESGFHPKAPYRKEHAFATKMEKMLAKELGVNWKKYDKEVESL